jgi:hypothetical protein
MQKTFLILALLAFIPFTRAIAQTGDIIYRDFEPDSILSYWVKLGPIWIDLDADGESDDLRMRMVKSGKICYPEFLTANTNTRICIVESNNIDVVLSEVAEEDWKNYIGWGGSMGSIPNRHDHYGFRIQREDGYYYGWFETYTREISSKDEKRVVHWGFDRTAYCTIPNYPLRWGETELVGVEETETKASAAVLHPNPTTGLVRIEGENAKEVYVYNALGQLVKTVQNTNEISLKGLPQGVYLLRVTTKDGKVFSDKVVKE